MGEDLIKRGERKTSGFIGEPESRVDPILFNVVLKVTDPFRSCVALEEPSDVEHALLLEVMIVHRYE